MQDTSIPAAVFVWQIENNSDTAVDVSIVFTFKNGQGEPQDKAGESWTEPFEYRRARGESVSGVMIHQHFRNMPCTYAIAAKLKVKRSKCCYCFHLFIDRVTMTQ